MTESDSSENVEPGTAHSSGLNLRSEPAPTSARKRSRIMDREDTAATLSRESNGRSNGSGSSALVRLSRRAAGILGLHVVRENALSGMRDAVGRHLALRRVPRGEA